MALIKKSAFFRSQKGFTLIETLVGIVILAAIGVTLMIGLSTGYKSVNVSQERTYAESLAKSQIEYIKSQDYISVTDYNPFDPEFSYEVTDIPLNIVAAGYSIEITPPEFIEVAGVSGYELQGIIIKIIRDGVTKLSVTFYRAGLAL